jgi:hypothetical protein
MEKDSKQFFRELKDDITTYAELKLELLKLDSYERISKLATILLYGLFISSIIFLAFFFIFLTLGFYLSGLLASQIFGFGIVSLICLLIVLIVYLNKEQINNKILNILIARLIANEQTEDKTVTFEEPINNENSDSNSF